MVVIDGGAVLKSATPSILSVRQAIYHFVSEIG